MQFKVKLTIHGMKVSEAFLVNTKNFESIIETLASHEADGHIVINSDLLERLSYSDPNDLLVIRILKDFSIIDNDGKPGKYFDEFRTPGKTKTALAKGLTEAYAGIFEDHPKIHQHQPDKVKEVFENHFKGKKTDLIIKYIAGTFEKIVSYVGANTVEKVLQGETLSEEELTAVSEQHTNGKAKEENEVVKREELSENNIDDFLSDFDIPENESAPEVEEAELKQTQEESSAMRDNNSAEESIDEPVSADNVEPENEQPPAENDTEEDDIFGIEDETEIPEELNEDTSSQHTETDKNTDLDPFDLEISLSEATKSINTMQNGTKEHQFVQKALVRKADLLHKMKRWEELVPTLETIIDRYDGQDQTDFKTAIERAVIRRALALLKLGKTDEALSALTTVIERFKESETEEFYEQASRAMLYKVNILENKQANADTLLPLYNSIIDRIDTSSEVLLKEKLDEIHCKRFDLLLDKNDSNTLLNASKKLIKRFADSASHQEYLQKAMIVRAETLDEMGEDEAALQAYNEFLARFGN